MPMYRMAAPTSRFRFRIRSLGSYYLSSKPPAVGLGQDFSAAFNPFTNAITPGSYAGGDVDASGRVTLQDVRGNVVPVGRVTATGTLSQTPKEAQAYTDLSQATLNSQFWGQATPPPSAGPLVSPGAEAHGIVSGSWLDGSTTLFGATVPNKFVAVGGAFLLLVMLNRKKR